MTRLTIRRLTAIEGALSAMLAGYEGEGDWPGGVEMRDMKAAWEWATDQINRRNALTKTKNGSTLIE